MLISYLVAVEQHFILLLLLAIADKQVVDYVLGNGDDCCDDDDDDCCDNYSSGYIVSTFFGTAIADKQVISMMNVNHDNDGGI